MPLFDHFHPALSERRPWESFNTTWASVLADMLNREVLPPGYIALEHVHAGAAIEVDVAATPTIAPTILPAVFPPSCTVEILSTEGGRTLAAAIELVSPGNKDRPVKRRQFAAKCATYLSRGIGLVVVDVVTSRQGNLHNELIDLLGLDAVLRMPPEQTVYGVAYRPLQENSVGRIETWPYALAVGQALPSLPLSLAAELCLEVDLEAAYVEACQRRRVDEAAGG